MTDKYQEEWLEREFVGYGMNPPNPRWPGGAKVCVSFVVQYYMGAEPNVLEGDDSYACEYLEIPKAKPAPVRNESSELMYEFGARQGVPRLLELFKKHQTPVTWNVFTRAIEKDPYWIGPILESGAEISCGGYKYRDLMTIAPEQEDEWISKSIDILQKATGDSTLPHGWLCERRSNLSVKLYTLAHHDRKLPLLYSSDSCQDDLPYWVPSYDKAGGTLMVPFSYDTSDLRFNMAGSGWASPKDWFEHLKDTFDCLVEEADDGEPKMMTVLLHPHIVGRPNRAFWLEEFIKYIESTSVGWIAKRQDIAAHWKKTFPYNPATAFGQTKVAPCGRI